MATKSQEARELTKMTNEFESLLNQFRTGKQLTDNQLRRVASMYIFGYMQFKTAEKEFKEVHSTMKKLVKENGRVVKSLFSLLELHWEERSRGKTVDTQFVVNSLSHDDLKTLLLNSKPKFDKKALGTFFSQDQLDDHSTEKTAEYLIPKKKKNVDDTEPKEMRMNSKFVKDLMKKPKLLLLEG